MARRSDLINVGRQHVIKDGYLRFTRKTNREIQILTLPPLKRAPAECDLHGLRKALGSRLAEAGLTEHQIAAVLGHAGAGAVKAYTRGADQKRLAAEALRTLEAQSVPLCGTKIWKWDYFCCFYQ